MLRSRPLAGVLFALAALVCGIGSSSAAERYPATIALPDGWLPEGIVTGRGPMIYSGSRADGAIYAADLRTGEGAVLVPGVAGRIAVGLDHDGRTNSIFVAGGATGTAFVHDAGTGGTLGAFALATATPTFVNDVIVTRRAAWFTDSNQPLLYRLPLGRGGALPAADAIERIPLTGDYQHGAGINLNGIVATRGGDALIAVHSTLGVLYRIDPETGVATTIDLGGASVTNGDGLLLDGDTLYVARNRSNEVAVFELAADLGSAALVDTIASPAFDVPTTIARHGRRLYVVNARFTTPPTPTTTYDIVQVPRE